MSCQFGALLQEAPSRTVLAMKLAIIITSDPQAGDEALGRAFNALALAHEARDHGDDVEVAFAGAGTRWPAELARPAHPAHGLYESVFDVIAGASRGCSVVFGATDAAGVRALADNPVPGTPGLVGVRRYLADGWSTLVF
jgi:hypothetical protein